MDEFIILTLTKIISLYFLPDTVYKKLYFRTTRAYTKCM